MHKLLPEEHEIVAVAVPDEQKGEQIILLTTHNIYIDELRQALLAQGCSPLLLPFGVVIPSYSIHYTKLYDKRCPSVPTVRNPLPLASNNMPFR